MPVDPTSRALLRVLDAGTSAEAAGVNLQLVANRLDREPSAAIDPWVAMLVGLLSIRFPLIFTTIDSNWTTSLVEGAPWSFDVQVIHARHLLAAAQEKNDEEQCEAVKAVVALLIKAQVAGSPFYRYTNQLFSEMVDGIAQYLEQHDDRLSAIEVASFVRVRRRWSRELPLQRGSGVTFTWLARDLDALKKRGVLVPNRHPTGRLTEHNTLVLLKGELSAGKISLLPARPSQRRKKSVARAASIERNMGVHLTARKAAFDSVRRTKLFAYRRDTKNSHKFLLDRISDDPGGRDIAMAEGDADPNKGGFGGQSRRGIFNLSAGFEQTESPKWVSVILTVTADESAKLSPEDYAIFVLHPTFSPNEVKVLFRSGRALLRIQTWDGFTVGVILPNHKVRLECDLTQLEEAPKIIKTR